MAKTAAGGQSTSSLYAEWVKGKAGVFAFYFVLVLFLFMPRTFVLVKFTPSSFLRCAVRCCCCCCNSVSFVLTLNLVSITLSVPSGYLWRLPLLVSHFFSKLCTPNSADFGHTLHRKPLPPPLDDRRQCSSERTPLRNHHT